MTRHAAVAVTSALSIVLGTLHLADDIVHGFERGGAANLVAVPVFAAWLLAALAPAERRWRYLVVLLGALLGLAVPLVHMTGAGVGGAIARSEGGFFFVWTILALGVTALAAAVLAAGGLWTLWRRRSA